MRKYSVLTSVVAMALLCAAALAQPMTVEGLVRDLSGDDLEARRAAWEAAPEFGVAAVLPIAGILADDDPSVVRAGQLALAAIATDAGDEAGPVTRALLAAMDLGLPWDQRVELLRYLSWVAGPGAVDRITPFLRDPDIAIAALMAIERIPGDESRQALVRVAASDSDTLSVPAIEALGARGEVEAEAPLLRIASSAEGPKRLAALLALGQVGSIDAVEFLGETSLGAPEAEIWQAIDSVLRITQRIEQAGDTVTAGEIYSEILDPGVPVDISPPQRLAALAGLVRVGDEDDVPTVLDSLDPADPIFLKTAMDFVVEHLGDEAMGALIEAAEETPPAQRAGITWMIAQLEAGDPVPYLIDALTAGEPAVVVAAADGLASSPDPRAWDVLMEIGKSEQDDVREAALGALLSILGATEDPPADPVDSYTWILEQTESAAMADAALLGLAEEADPSLLPLVEPYTQQPETRAAALALYCSIGIALADAGEDGRAREILTNTVRRGASRAVANAAISVLRDLGVETDFARDAGFITRWRVIGPFDTGLSAWNEGLEDVLTADLAGATRDREWLEVDSPDIQGVVNLLPLMDPNQNAVAYAVAEVVVDSDIEATLKLGSDDGVVVWLNGEKVHQNNAGRPVQVDQDQVDVTLTQGVNRIVLKILQGGGDWGYTLRITDRDGQPLTPEVATP